MYLTRACRKFHDILESWCAETSGSGCCVVRAEERLPAGRRVVWTTDLLVEVGLEWKERHRRLPRASDWTVSRARRLGGDALERLRRPPTEVSRWPAASTVNDAFGSWARYRIECEHSQWAPRPRTPAAAAYPGSHTVDDAEALQRVHLHGDAYVIDGLRKLWQGHDGRSSYWQWQFLAWTILNGHAILPNVATTSSADIAGFDRQLRNLAEALGEVHLIFPEIAVR